MSTERIHHPYSPSQLMALEACPSYEGKQSDAPHPRTIIGTISHAAIEARQDDARLSDEDAAQAAKCLEFYDNQKRRMELSGPVTELQETYLEIDDAVFHDAKATTAGYIDAAIISHDRRFAILLDWKLGFWQVAEASENLQAWAYTLGLFKRYPELETVKFFFVQPNAEFISEAIFTRAQIPALNQRIQVVVARARAARSSGDFAMARASASTCSFCKNIAICPVITAMACKVGAKFSPLAVPSDITPSKVHDPADTLMGLQLAQVVEVWASAFRAVITGRVVGRQAEPPPGYRLESRAKREIVDARKYREAALKHLTPDEYEATLSPSLTQVETLISEKAPRGSKTAAVKNFAEEIEETGAVVKGEPFAFLKLIPQKSKPIPINNQ